jgi:hypothetical protein
MLVLLLNNFVWCSSCRCGLARFMEQCGPSAAEPASHLNHHLKKSVVCCVQISFGFPQSHHPLSNSYFVIVSLLKQVLIVRDLV